MKIIDKRGRHFDQRIGPIAKAIYPGFLKGESYLDIAAGYGADATYLQEINPGARVVGVDLNLKPFRKIVDLDDGVDYSYGRIKDLHEKQGTGETLKQVHLLPANGLYLPFKGDEGVFDRVSALSLFQHMPRERRQEMMKEVYRVMKEDGAFLSWGWSGKTLAPFTRLKGKHDFNRVFPRKIQGDGHVSNPDLDETARNAFLDDINEICAREGYEPNFMDMIRIGLAAGNPHCYLLDRYHEETMREDLESAGFHEVRALEEPPEGHKVVYAITTVATKP